MSTSPLSPQASALARTAGLRELRIPHLEDVDRRRAQLWGLSVFVSLAVPVVMVVVGLEGLPAVIQETVDIRTARLILLAMLVVVIGYIAEREITLRRLTGLLVEERVLTASLVNRVDELNLLVRATKAMNSALELQHVLTQIAESAHGLLQAGGVTLHLLEQDATGKYLRVAAVYGRQSFTVGLRQGLDEGLAGKAVREGDALLDTGHGAASGRYGPRGRAIAVPLEVRGELVGVLSVHIGDDRDEFTEFDLRGVSVFANAAAAAITNARAYEEQLGKVADLLEADHAKDEFLTLITHELRTPLTSMIGLLGTMATRAASLRAEQVSEFARIAQAQGWRLDRLIGDLLDSSRAQRRSLQVTPEPTAVDRMLRRAVTALAHSVPERTIALDVPEGLVRSVDADVVLRITDNLLSNAVKYTPEASPVEVVVTEHAREIRIDVVDHGPGIPPADRTSLFGRFVRGADPYERGGLGLGLFVVRALAEAHAGWVEVGETPGGGTTVSVGLSTWQADSGGGLAAD